MKKNKINARGNSKLDLTSRPKHYKSTNPQKRNKPRASRAKTESKRMRTIGYRSVLEELSKPQTVYALGWEPVYVHSNRIYATKGMETTVFELQKILQRKVIIAKNKLNYYANILKQREEHIYKNSDGIVDSWEKMQKLWKRFTIDNPNESLANYIQNLIDFKNSYTVMKNAKAGVKNQYQDQFVNSMKYVENFINKSWGNFSSKPGNNEKILKWLKQGEDGGWIETKQGKIKFLNIKGLESLATLLGFQLEDILINSIDTVGGSYAIDVVTGEILANIGLNPPENKGRLAYKKISARTLAQERIGKVGQGSSDMAVTIGSAEFGISAKFSRVYNFDDINPQTEISMTSSVSRDNFTEYYNSTNTAFSLSHKELDLLYYGMANYKVWNRLGNGAEFVPVVQYLLAWGGVLQAVLGVDFSSTSYSNAFSTLLPVFLTTGAELYKTADILRFMAGLNDKEILSIVNKHYSFGGLFDKISNFDTTGLYDAKKTVLATRRAQIKNKEQVPAMNYNILHYAPEVRPILASLNIKQQCKVNISYRILMKNIANSK